MKQSINKNGFKVYEVTNEELSKMTLLKSHVCDFCDYHFNATEKFYYVCMLNKALCPNCLKSFNELEPVYDEIDTKENDLFIEKMNEERFLSYCAG